jgi:hypothetical protein
LKIQFLNDLADLLEVFPLEILLGFAVFDPGSEPSILFQFTIYASGLLSGLFGQACAYFFMCGVHVEVP